MAKISLMYTEDEGDGLKGSFSVLISRDNVETVEDLEYFLEQAVRSIGFDYVENVSLNYDRD